MLTGKVSYRGEGTFPNIGSSTLTLGTQTYEFNNTSALGSYFNAHRAIPKSRWMLGVWHELVVAVTWSTRSTGRVTVWQSARASIPAGRRRSTSRTSRP